MRQHGHCCVKEVVKYNGTYITMQEYRRIKPLTWREIESNRLAFLYMLWQKEQNKS